MIRLVLVLVLAFLLIVLVRRGKIQVDMSMPWLFALVVFGFLSVNPAFVDWVGGLLGILYPPIAIVFITIAILLGLVTVLLIAFSRLHARQIAIVRALAEEKLSRQEAPSPRGAVAETAMTDG